MIPDEHRELIRRLFAARAAGDMDAALATLADDIVLDASRRILDPMVMHGHEGFRAFVAALDEAWAMQQPEPGELVEAGGRIVVPLRLTSTSHSGATVVASPAWVVEIADGRIARLTVHQSADEALAAARSDRPGAARSG